ncbi:MAG: oxygen-insensitive NADPH nitroreductase [Pseudomonadota bacterium]
MNDVIALLRAHRSIRKFRDEPVDDETVATLIACAQAAATSSNVQATSVIRVRDPDTRDALATLAGGQPYVASSSVFLVFCADLYRARLACAVQDTEMVEGMTEHFMIATIDVALAAQNAVVAAESLGLGICYIGGLRNNPEEVSTLLGLPDQVYPVFGLCIGHPDQDPEVKPRLPLPAVLMEERYQADDDSRAHIAAYDDTLRAYYRSRTGGKKDSSWTEEMAGLTGKESRPHMRGFLTARGFARR